MNAESNSPFRVIATDLGPLEREHGPASHVQNHGTSDIVVLAFVGIALLAWPALMPGNALAIGIGVTAGIAMLVAAVGIAIRRARKRRVRVAVHRNGLVAHVDGRDHEAVWDAIVSVKSFTLRRTINGVDAGTIHRHELTFESGVRITLTDWIDDIDALIDRIRRETGTRLLPLLRSRLAQPGSRVDLGAVAVLNDGLEAANRVVSFALIESVRISEGHFVVICRDDVGTPRMRVPVSRIANLHVLLPLISERTRGLEP